MPRLEAPIPHPRNKQCEKYHQCYNCKNNGYIFVAEGEDDEYCKKCGAPDCLWEPEPKPKKPRKITSAKDFKEAYQVTWLPPEEPLDLERT